MRSTDPGRALWRIRRTMLVALLVSGWMAHPAPADPTPKRRVDVAQPATRPAGAPRYSDVCLSSRWKRPVNEDDPHDSLKAIEAFHATRLEWAYIADRDFVRRIKDRGMTFAPVVNSMTFVGELRGAGKRGRIVDRHGEIVTAPWMRMWRASGWGCVNSPDYRASYLQRLKEFADLGADSIHVDDPGCNWTATRWGACFCEHCMEGFRAFLAEGLDADALKALDIDDIARFDYAARLDRDNAPTGDDFAAWEGGPLKEHFVRFQRRSVERFYPDVWDQLEHHAGRRIPMTTNNAGQHWTFPFELFDWGVGELSHHNAHPDRIRNFLRAARDLGKAQVFTLVSEDVGMNRRVIAFSYANGGHMIVPWDVYLRSTPEGSDRYFGRPEEYADLYGFVRANAEYFDGYEDAAALGPWIEDDRYGPAFPMRFSREIDALAFARARPGRPEAPIVVHLINREDPPGAFTFSWTRAAFFGDAPVRAEYRRPDGPPLRLDVRDDGDARHVTIDEPHFWGLLIVAPAR